MIQMLELNFVNRIARYHRSLCTAIQTTFIPNVDKNLFDLTST